MEHNANWRPFESLRIPRNFLTKVNLLGEVKSAVSRLENALTPSTRLFVTVHGSNVSGDLLPLEELTQCAHRYGVKVYCDMAQNRRISSIRFSNPRRRLCCFCAIKFIRVPAVWECFMCGKPKVLYRLNMVVQECIRNPPTCQIFYQIALESGTPNLMGIGGLIGGIQYIQNRGIDDINRQEIALTERFLTGLETMDHITIYGRNVACHEFLWFPSM